MIAYIWRYEVPEEHRAAFETAYGPKGDWARLFADSEGYRGTELMRGPDGTYLTLDVWRDRTDLEAFLSAHRQEYVELDRRTQAWTRAEQSLGEYVVLD